MKYILSGFFILFILSEIFSQQGTIIPKPRDIQANDEEAFTVTEDAIIVADSSFALEASFLIDYIERMTGKRLPISYNTDKVFSSSTISISKSNDNLSDEEYQLSVSNKKIEIWASYTPGAYYGCMTLLQSIKNNEKSGLFTIAAMEVNDKPRFGWRGLMLDCSRTFISMDYIKRTIERMSFYKLNTLHLHLTDDQGWRLEIEDYPLLTSKGAYFADNFNEPKDFEGFYTRDQMQELIDYGEKRNVRIVPEIEVPGHSHAALYAYPELSCSGDITPVFPFFGGPNMTGNDVFCAGNDSTYIFFKKVLDEVASLFPAKFIHLGGDEVRDAWKDCEKCDSLRMKYSLKDNNEVQGYVMNKVVDHVLHDHKRPIGWDEVFFTGVNKEMIIMVWREESIADKAIEAGYDVILTPRKYLYFDYGYSGTPTSKVYSYEPISEKLNSKKKHILGIQGSFWSHIDRTESKIDYQIYPRLLALAERAWSPGNVNNYTEFENRMHKQKFWLGLFDIKYNLREF